MVPKVSFCALAFVLLNRLELCLDLSQEVRVLFVYSRFITNNLRTACPSCIDRLDRAGGEGVSADGTRWCSLVQGANLFSGVVIRAG